MIGAGISLCTGQPWNIVLHGNSLWTSVGSRLATLAGLSLGSTVFEESVGGATITGTGGFENLNARFSADVHTHYNSSRRNRVYVWEGLDEINDAAGTGASTFASHQTYVATARTAGWEVFVCTIIATLEYTAASPHPTRGDLEPERLGFNARARAAWLGNVWTPGIGVCDLRARANLQDASDTTYFNADGIHLVGAGQDEAAEGVFGSMV